jgi:hypothetical protein
MKPAAIIPVASATLPSIVAGKKRSAYLLRRLNGVTIIGGSTSEAMVWHPLNVVSFKNMTEHPEQAKKGVSYRRPLLRSTATRW